VTDIIFAAIPSPYDERDHPLSAHYELPVGVTVPDRARADGIPVPPYDQAGTPECVAFSAAGDGTIVEHPATGGLTRFNAHELYARCKEQDGSPNQEGTYIRVAADIRKNRGMYATDGLLHKIASYSRLAIATADDLELAIYSASELASPQVGGSPWVAGDWPANWMSFRGTGVLPKPSGSAGGHAFKIVEHWRTHPSGQCMKILNSWDGRWGDGNGEAWVRYSDLFPRLWEGWKTFAEPTPDPFQPRESNVFVAVDPFRAVDTRINQGLIGPLVSDVGRKVQIAGVRSIPATAEAVTGILTVVGPETAGWATAVPQLPSTISMVNFPQGDTRASGFTVGLGADGTLTLIAGLRVPTTKTHVLLDITGYFTA
jgi:hypothetical protein